MKKHIPTNQGFTLIEIIVAVAIFVVVMLIAVGAVLNAVDANRKAQSMNAVVNNLNLAFESMIRDLRTGRDYFDCGTGCIQFTDKDGNTGISYVFVNDEEGSYILKGPASLPGAGRITGEEVFLDEVSFQVEGVGTNDGPQRILLNIRGSAGAAKTKSVFNVQTLITSRYFDADELI